MLDEQPTIARRNHEDGPNGTLEANNFTASKNTANEPHLRSDNNHELKDKNERLAPTSIFVQHIHTHSILIFLAIWGLLTRLGLNAIGDYESRSVFSLLLVQFSGCLIMGISVSLKDRLDKLHSLIYLGLTTGYCGSVTTFSSWILQVFQAFLGYPSSLGSRFQHVRIVLINLKPTHPLADNSLSPFQLLTGFNLSYVTVGICIFALQLGNQLGLLLDRTLVNFHPCRRLSCLMRGEYPVYINHVSSIMIAILGPLTWLASIFLSIYGPLDWRGKVSYSMVISPCGTLLRFYLAKLNLSAFSKANGFPIGTFTANLLATTLLALFTSLQFTTRAKGHPALCAALQGLNDGFCGCLSTISTFFFELQKSGVDRKSLRYALVSWCTGQIACVLLFGIYRWTHDLGDRCRFPT